LANFILILLCLVAGALLRRAGKMPVTSARAFNAFIIYLSFPGVVLLKVPAFLASLWAGQSSAFDVFVLVSMPWLMMFGAMALFAWLGKKLGWSEPTVGALILTAGFSNTSFVGFPILESLLGPQSIQNAVIVDQAGCFLAMSTVGLVVASFFSGTAISGRTILRRVLLFPPLIALAAAVLTFFAGIEITGVVKTVCERLGETLVPIALVSVGIQLHVSPALLKRRGGEMALGLGYKLLLAPLLFTILYVALLGSRSEATQITLLESAMAPIITGAVIAAEYGLDTEISNLMVGVGIPVSLLTVPLIHWLTRGFF
jgi:hypothetical protein